MDMEKLKIFMGRKKAPNKAQREFVDATNKLRQEAELVRGLMNQPGWKLLEKFFDAKQKVLFQELKVCDKKDFEKLQLKSQIIDEFYNFLTAKLLRDPDL